MDMINKKTPQTIIPETSDSDVTMEAALAAAATPNRINATITYKMLRANNEFFEHVNPPHILENKNKGPSSRNVPRSLIGEKKPH